MVCLSSLDASEIVVEAVSSCADFVDISCTGGLECRVPPVDLQSARFPEG